MQYKLDKKRQEKVEQIRDIYKKIKCKYRENQLTISRNGDKTYKNG